MTKLFGNTNLILLQQFMFARQGQKKTQIKKKSVVTQAKKKIVFSNARINVHQAGVSKFNKIASIRTLPPFAYMNSESGTNSQRKSVEPSETNSEVWREECQLFQSDHKQTIKNLDKQLQEVLETIKKERNLIDMKIWKLRAKLHESHLQNSKANQVQVSSTATSTLNRQMPTQSVQKWREKEIQFPQPLLVSSYLKKQAQSLKLILPSNFISKEHQEIDEETKVRENKEVLKILFDRLDYS